MAAINRMGWRRQPAGSHVRPRPAVAPRSLRTNCQAKHEKKIAHHEKVINVDALQDRKKRLRALKEQDGYANGRVWIPGPLDELMRTQILNEIRNVAAGPAGRADRILVVAASREGIEVLTDGEKLAQRLADALARSRKAHVSRVYDDGGQCRVLTCRLPEDVG